MECKNCPIGQTAPHSFPPQHQDQQPGLEYQMDPRPISECAPTGPKLANRVALITGGDSGIGRAVAYAIAKEGAKVSIAYYDEDRDAQETAEHIRQLGGECLLLRGDLKDPAFAKRCVEQTVEHFGTLDILINNHAVQFIRRSILDITREQLSLVDQGIRVNAVAPGPIWTPLIPASFSAEEVRTFGSSTSKVPMLRAGQPCEVAPCYVFLASDDSSYMTGQVLHPNGGTIVGS